MKIKIVLVSEVMSAITSKYLNLVKINMYKIMSCVIAILFLSNGSFQYCKNQLSKNSERKIRAITVSYMIPIVNWDSTITENKSTYEVFYYEKVIMYKFSYNFDSTLNGKLLLREKRNYYFVSHEDSLFGYNYFPHPQNSFPDGRQLVDSVLKINTFENNKLDTFLNHKPDSSYFDNERNFIKVFNLPLSKEYPENFTIYLKYTKKLKGINETFSKKMDNVNDMKLFKIRILAQGAYYEQYKMSFPKREFLYEMKEIPVENREEILNYFKKYKEEILQ